MRKFFKILSANLIVFLLLLNTTATAAYAQTSQWSGVCVGPGEGSLGPGVDATDVATVQGLECLIANIFTVIITLIGLAGLVMFIVGGFMWMLSGSNSGNTEKARNAITYAVVGIVVALSAFIIINLIANFTGVQTITKFIIPDSDTGL